MRKTFLSLFLLLSVAATSLATNIRGLVFRQGPYGVTYPVPNLTILVRDQMGNNMASPAVTGIDGMYYFYGMFPGNYYLDIYSGYLFVGRFIISIDNTPNAPGVFSDIPPVGLQ